MQLRLFAGVVSALLLAGSTAGASSFDEKTGILRLDADLLLSQSFDTNDAVHALPVQVFSVTHQQGYGIYEISADPIEIAQDAIEGKGALRVHGDRAVLVGDAASLAPLAAGRVEVKFFAKADGAGPSIHVVYARKPLDAKTLSFPTGDVVAIRTGRVTSDGWVEYSSGPIDGNAIGATIAGFLITPSADSAPGTSFLVDALEVKKVDAPLLSGAACHIASEAKDCTKGAVCMEGKCVDAALAYGALPPAETRKDIAARAIFLMTRIQNDRHAVAASLAGFAKEYPPIAASADTPDAFYRPYFTGINGARGAHTYAPAPNPYSRLAAGAMLTDRYYGSELNACFGLVEKDLAGGGRGYGVYQVADGSPLAVGDVIHTVDGEPVDTWMARIATEHALLAADPDSDGAYMGEMMTSAVMRFGRELVVQRCQAGDVCTPVAIDLADQRTKTDGIVPMRCGPRFHLAVDVPSGVDPNAYDAAIVQTDASGFVNVHTNGEPYVDNDAWVASITKAFDDAANGMLVDKRRGDGGGGAALEAWARNLRRDSSFGLYFVDRIDHVAIDGAPGFLTDMFSSCDGKSMAGKCAFGNLETYVARAGALPRKTAWLDVLDGSASDMSTYFAKGASGVRIFAPNRTMGLFGGLGEMGSFLEGWNGGSVQIGDTREGNTKEERASGTWHSGKGVAPDEIIVQKQSDLIAGRDTMLERARAWLAEP